MPLKLLSSSLRITSSDRLTEKVTVFCSNGCNLSQSPKDDPWDFCVTCHKVMLPEHKQSYDRVHASFNGNAISAVYGIQSTA